MEAGIPEWPNEEGLTAFSERSDEPGAVTVLLVEYPNRRAFLEMIGSEDYRAIAHLRTEALAPGELHPLSGVELPA